MTIEERSILDFAMRSRHRTSRARIGDAREGVAELAKNPAFYRERMKAKAKIRHNAKPAKATIMKVR